MISYKLIVIYMCIFLTEILISIIVSLGYNIFDGFYFQNYLFNSINVSIVWNLWRLMFYYIPLIIVFFILFKYFNCIKIYKPAVFSIFNVLAFVGLNFLYKLHRGLPTLEFTESLFWITIVSIILSPIILGQIPYFRRLMENI